MTEQESEEQFKRTCDVLVQRGFARSYVYYDRVRGAAFDWTPEGEQLHRSLHRLFDIPNVSPRDLTPSAILDLVTVFVFTSPGYEII